MPCQGGVNPPEKEVTKINQPQPPDNPEETYYLLDLPVEILEKILDNLDSYQEVQRVKVECRKLCKVANNVLRSAYLQLETELRRDVENHRRLIDQKLDRPAPPDSPDFNNWDKSVRDASERLFIINQLQPIISLAKVTIWSLSSMHSYYDAELLDLIYKTRNEAIEESGQLMTSAWNSKAKCTDVYNKNIARFSRRFSEVQRSIENQRKAQILSVCTLVDTMMGIEVADWSKLQLTRHSRVDHNGRNLATFAVSVSFCAWLPSREATKEAIMEIASKKTVSKLLVILQKFAWNARSQKSVLDNLCPNNQIWVNLQLSTTVLTRLHIPEIRVRGISSRNNSQVTNDCDEISDTETEWRDMRDCRCNLGVSFSNSAIGDPMLEALFSKIVVNVVVEITCCEDWLLEYLIRKATFVEEI